MQTTLAQSVKASGTGLHTGVSVNLTLKPAPENTGYIFVRTDLDDFEIPASLEYISLCSYATTLLRKGVVLSTCEHLLSALRGCGVDNCFIELDNMEIPIMDGSSENFVELKDLDYFKNIHLAFGTVQWQNEQDFAPETLYIESVAIKKKELAEV